MDGKANPRFAIRSFGLYRDIPAKGNEEDSGKGLGVMWELTIIYQYLYNAGVVNEKFIPVVFGRDNTKYIPIPLQPTTYYEVGSKEGYESLYRRLTDQPYTTKPKLGSKKKLAPRERKKGSSEFRVSLAKLPSTSPDLFGREKELKELDDAWDNPKINVVSLVAWGGVGKSALVNKWLSQMARGQLPRRGAGVRLVVLQSGRGGGTAGIG